ncbi:MAG: UDP-N-acetylmuramoyl-L-alanine--D-glutamate ligase [Candidatus Protochlamydia sp.]|nr:UDP-N-acetylmuramoyl-L-alanine--D-glutamate ligase [Candidatus Protochlamydia sp.]
MDALYKGKKVLVIGMGLSGRSAATFLLQQGAQVIGIDRDSALLKNNPQILKLKEAGLSVQHENEIDSLASFNLAILSPGISRTHPIVQQALSDNIELIGEIQLGCRHAKQPLIGITGTNGKTTVTLLVAHVLNQNGFSAKALGNIGEPLAQEMSYLGSEEIIVLELSSQQLESLGGPFLEQGVILNITPDHLDCYSTMEDYAAAKLSMQGCMKPGGKLWVEQSTFEGYAPLFHSPVSLFGYTPDCLVFTDLKAVYLEGSKSFDLPSSLNGKMSHDLDNTLAAFALCSSRGISGEHFKKSLMTFQKPPHRIQFVIEKKGVRYYDDSKGTNVDAVIKAVCSIEGPIVLIAGGVDKGSSYTPWLQPFKDKVKYICAIGQAAAKLEGQLAGEIPVFILANLEHAVRKAEGLAEKGGAVLLSPGCASYDMFKNYVQRGEEFQRLVRRDFND